MGRPKKAKNNIDNIKEINKQMSDSLKFWSDVALMADADNWAYYLEYSDEDVLSAINIFMHVLMNRGIKSGHLNENATEKGIMLRNAISDFCGIDTVALVNDVLHRKKEPENQE